MTVQTGQDREMSAGHGPIDDPPLLGAVLDALPELVFVLDRDGRYVDVLGGRDDTRYHDGRSLVGKRMHDVLPHELADGFLARIREALDTGEVLTYEYTLSAQDVEGVESRPGVPDHLWFEGRVAPLPPTEGRQDLVVWMLFNVTEARVATQQLEQRSRELERQRAELEVLARSKDRILSVVSHDLRSPLTSIQGFLELLDQRWDELDANQAHDFVRRGIAKAEQMQVMLHDLLDAARDEGIQATSRPRDVSVADVLDDVVGGLAADDDGVVVTEATGRVHVDPVHLERIVVNLVDNARKYGAPPIEIEARPHGDRVQVRVRDHGSGVPAGFIDQLFTPFTQAGPGATTGEDTGVGLGLSIVQQLARQNGGEVTYEAPEDGGACFTVTLRASATG